MTQSHSFIFEHLCDSCLLSEPIGVIYLNKSHFPAEVTRASSAPNVDIPLTPSHAPSAATMHGFPQTLCGGMTSPLTGLGFWYAPDGSESMSAHGLYKPLDDRTLEPAAISLVFISGGIGFWFYLACKPTSWNLQFVSRLFACVGLVLVLYSAFVILNGILDHYPLVQAETRVVRTYRSGRRGDDFYIVVIPSWRRGETKKISRLSATLTATCKRVT